MLDRAIVVVTIMFACLVIDGIFARVSKEIQILFTALMIGLYVWKGKS